MPKIHWILLFALYCSVTFAQDDIGAAECAVGCLKGWLGDGYCDKECNVPPCRYDAGDCCARTCQDGPVYACGEGAGYKCKDPHAMEAENERDLKEVKYSKFTIWLNCARRSAEMFEYSLYKDMANLHRPEQFNLDPNAELRNCQQHSHQSYHLPNCNRNRNSGRNDPYCFDRGHLVTSNHMDNSDVSIREANLMTNIVPQATGFNQEGGAWYETEVMTECLRERTNVRVIGGVAWGDGSRNYFVQSHGIETPEKMWKILLKVDTHNNIIDLNAWLMPNHFDTTVDKLDSYLVSVREIEDAIGRDLEIPHNWKMHKATTSFTYPPCDQS